LVPGAVVWAHVPFEDGEGEKTRPAVVAQLSGRDVTLYPGTTSGSRIRHGHRYVEVRDLGAAGLNRPTGIKRSFVVVDVIEVIDVVGDLSRADLADLMGETRLPSRDIQVGLSDTSGHLQVTVA
jgi:hypothetical protein